MGSRRIFVLALFIFAFLTKRGNAQTISPVFFGQNAWMPDTIGNASNCLNAPCILYGKLHKKWNNIKNSYASVIRFGGIAPDKNKPTNFQYIKMIDSIRAKGMEPIIQVPFHLNQYTAQQAAAIVQYVNITKAKNIKYWIIGNEPDLGYSYTSAAQVAAYFKPFASAMKAVDPTILTIGPECAWYNTNIINGLTTPNGPDDITGKDASGRYYCDIISFHCYGFNGTQTRAQVISKLTSPGDLQDDLTALNTRLANCNAVHGRTGAAALRSAVTEANVGYQNSSTDNLYGTGANSFIGAQFVAEMLGIGMKQNVNFMTLWSVVEGNTTALNIGYIDGSTGNMKPLYHHFKMLAENFKGTYVGGASNLPNIKTFGSKDGNAIRVIVMNQELATNHNFTLRLNSGTVSGTNPLKLTADAGLPVEFNDVINNQTTILLTFNLSGTLVQKCVYSLADHAAFNLPPSCMNVTGALPITLVNFAAKLTGNSVRLDWSTASEKDNKHFTVQRSKNGADFEDVWQVAGAGTTFETHHYYATDNSPYPGVSYYRLKQTDFEGAFSFSDTRVIDNETAEDMITIFPNPGDGSYINIGMKNAAVFSVVSLYDMQGKAIEWSVQRSVDSRNQVELRPAVPLATGIYLLLLAHDGVISNHKIMVR